MADARWLDRNNPRLASTIIAFSWVQDGLGEEEMPTLRALLELARGNNPAAVEIAKSSWMQTRDVDRFHLIVLEELKHFYEGLATATVVASASWIQDGITELEADMVDVLNTDATLYPLVDMPWIEDGITEMEAEIVYALGREPDLRSLIGRSWMQDGITETEAELIELISYDSAVYGLVDMPFLASVEPVDVTVVWSLLRLNRWNPPLLEYVLEHPALVGGIADSDTYRVTVISDKMDTFLVDKVLNSDQTSIEFRTINLPLTGEIELAVIRHNAGSKRTMDLLEYAVSYFEDIHGLPFPIGHATILFNTDLVPNGGFNAGTHMGAQSEYDADNSSYESKELPGLLAHETAHYYWGGNNDPVWINEGLANTLGAISEHHRIGDRLAPENKLPCSRDIGNIEELEASSDEQQQKHSWCFYAFGEHLFLELYDKLGHDAFGEGLKRLYLKSKDSSILNIDDVAIAFGGSETVREIAYYWHSGKAMPR